MNCVLATLGTRYGEGMHEINIPPDYVVPALKLNYATAPIYQASLCFTKLSICVFYLRVFTTTKRARYHVYALIAFLLAFSIPLELTLILSCVPPRKVWLPSTPGHCLDEIIGFWTSFACNLASDIWLIVFAAPRIWGLKMQARQKVALLATLTLGWVVVIAAILRVVRIAAILHSDDTTWRAYDSSIWSAVEVNVSITCAAGPALKPVFKHFTPGFMYSLSGKASQVKPGNTDRTTWIRASQKGNGVFEMSRSVTRHDLTSHSQEELANTMGQTQWVTGRLNMTASEDGISEEGRDIDSGGILKITQVTVSHWPTHSGRPG